MIMVADWRKTSSVSDEKDLRIMELGEIIWQQDRKIVYTQGRVVDLEGEIKKTRKVRASAQEVVELDPSLVNWNEPGVNHIEVFRTRFGQVEARMGTVMEENKVVMEENKTMMEEIVSGVIITPFFPALLSAAAPGSFALTGLVQKMI